MEINGTPPHLITLFIIPSKALPFLVINKGGKNIKDFDWRNEQTLYWKMTITALFNAL